MSLGNEDSRTSRCLWLLAGVWLEIEREREGRCSRAAGLVVARAWGVAMTDEGGSGRFSKECASPRSCLTLRSWLMQPEASTSVESLWFHGPAHQDNQGGTPFFSNRLSCLVCSAVCSLAEAIS